MKPWYLSKGIIGAVVSMIAMLFGTSLDAGSTEMIASNIMIGVGALLSAYGRVTATDTLSMK